MYTYSSEHGWGTLASTLDNPRGDLYQQLHALDFTHADPAVLLCRAGTLRIYVRSVPSGKKAQPLAFDFCCILAIGGWRYLVGLKTLQDLFAFLKEIGAHPSVPQAVALTDGERKAVQESIAAIIDQVEQRIAPLLNMAAWQKTIERLVQALEAIHQQATTSQINILQHTLSPSVSASQQNANPTLPETSDTSKYSGG